MSLPEEIPDEGETQGGGRERGWGSKVPASCSSTVQADLTRGKQESEGSPVTKKCEHGGPKRGHDLSSADRTDRAAQAIVQYQRARPPEHLLHR